MTLFRVGRQLKVGNAPIIVHKKDGKCARQAVRPNSLPDMRVVDQREALNLINADTRELRETTIARFENVASGPVHHFFFRNACQRAYICPSSDNRSALITCNWCLIFQVGDGKHNAVTPLTTQ
jgi:hypothetical protein